MEGHAARAAARNSSDVSVMKSRTAALLAGSVGAAIAILAAGSGALLRAQTPPIPYVLKDFYEKREVMIPMRDGVKLFTVLYIPRDRSKTYPFLVIRDAYGVRPYGPDNYRRWAGAYLEFSKEGFIFVYQDVRGRWKSEGEFVHHQPYVKGGTEATSTRDMYDTAEWLLANVPNHNGRISQRGVSWTGWEAAMGMIEAHPAIRLSSPQAPPQDQFLGDDYHSGGAFQLAYAFHWMSENAHRRPEPTEVEDPAFDYGTPDGYQFFLSLGAAANAKKYFGSEVPTYDELMDHGTYDEYLASAQRAPASRWREAPGADRRRLARCGGLCWGVPHVSWTGEEQSGK